MSPVRRSIRGSEDSLKRTLSRCKGKKGVEHSVSLHGRTLLKFKAQLFLCVLASSIVCCSAWSAPRWPPIFFQEYTSSAGLTVRPHLPT
jgi:hypothetical protein